MTGSVSISNVNAATRARKLSVRAVILGAAIGVLIALIASHQASETIFDTWQKSSPREITDDNIAVVMIDNLSVERGREWPWPRYNTAQLISIIGEGQPRAIGIDIYFSQPDPLSPQNFVERFTEEELDQQTSSTILGLPRMDDFLEEKIRTTPSVLARFGSVENNESSDFYFPVSKDGSSLRVTGEPPADVLTTDYIRGSLFEFDQVAMSQGMINGAPDADGVVRRVPLSVTAAGEQAPGFALELARLENGAETLRWENGQMMLGQKIIPADENGAMRFKMGSIPDSAKYSAIEVFEGFAPEDAFTDKIVLLGVTATGTFDIVATPLNPEIRGVLVQAQAVDAIIEGDWLSRPPSMIAAEVAAGLILLGLILAYAVWMRGIFAWAAFGLAIAVPFASWFLYVNANLLFDPSRPLIIAAAAATALAGTRFFLTRAALFEERVRASTQQGELDAAFRIQMSMVPSEKTLSRLDKRVEVSGVLHPAKSVGGDFFDAVKIGDNILLFLVADVTGKGVPAALFMALSKTLSKSKLARAGEGLEQAVAELNSDLMEEADDEMGLTMLVGTIDCATGDIELINAGHENPIIVRQDRTTDTVPLKGGPPLCVIDWPYEIERMTLLKGETLVVISDGATEATNINQELFGPEGVEEALTNCEDISAAGRANYLADQVRKFEGENDPTDDLTIFAMRYLGGSI